MIKNKIILKYLMFLIGCMGSRFLLTYLTKTYSNNKQTILGYFMLIIGLGFLYVYFIGSDRADRQLEWTGHKDDKKIWWNNSRIVHGLLYLVSGLIIIFDLKYKKNVWILLLVDTLIGLIAWINHKLKIY